MMKDARREKPVPKGTVQILNRNKVTEWTRLVDGALTLKLSGCFWVLS